MDCGVRGKVLRSGEPGALFQHRSKEPPGWVLFVSAAAVVRLPSSK